MIRHEKASLAAVVVALMLLVSGSAVAQEREGVYPPCTELEEIDWEAYSRARVDVEIQIRYTTFSGETNTSSFKTVWRIMAEGGLVRLQYEEHACVLIAPTDASAFVRALRLLATTPDMEEISRRGMAWSLSVKPIDSFQHGILTLTSSASVLATEIPPSQMNKFADAVERVILGIGSDTP